MKNFIYPISILLFAMLFQNCKQTAESLSFVLSPEEALQKVLSEDYLLSASDFKNMASEEVTLVDLRSPADFMKSHMPNAVNVPVAHILDEENYEMLRAASSVVLYGEDVSQANGPRFLLSQLGFDKVKILETGFGSDSDAEGFEPESARYNYAAIFQKAIERHAEELEASKPKPTIIRKTTASQEAASQPKKTIVPKRKKIEKVVEEEEGC